MIHDVDLGWWDEHTLVGFLPEPADDDFPERDVQPAVPRSLWLDDDTITLRLPCNGELVPEEVCEVDRFEGDSLNVVRYTCPNCRRIHRNEREVE